MNLAQEISHIDSIFIDTVPVIYYIEAHPKFGYLPNKLLTFVRQGN